MNSPIPAERDERTVAIEHYSYHLGFVILYFSLIFDVFYRVYARQGAPWDLLALLLVSGIVATFYQARERAIARVRIKRAVLTFVTAIVLGTLIFTLMDRSGLDPSVKIPLNGVVFGTLFGLAIYMIHRLVRR